MPKDEYEKKIFTKNCIFSKYSDRTFYDWQYLYQ